MTGKAKAKTTSPARQYKDFVHGAGGKIDGGADREKESSIFHQAAMLAKYYGAPLNAGTVDELYTTSWTIDLLELSAMRLLQRAEQVAELQKVKNFIKSKRANLESLVKTLYGDLPPETHDTIVKVHNELRFCRAWKRIFEEQIAYFKDNPDGQVNTPNLFIDAVDTTAQIAILVEHHVKAVPFLHARILKAEKDLDQMTNAMVSPFLKMALNFNPLVTNIGRKSGWKPTDSGKNMELVIDDMALKNTLPQAVRGAIRGLSPAAQHGFLFIISVITGANAHGKQFAITVDDYMRYTGITSREWAARMLREIGQELMDMQLKITIPQTGKSNKKLKSYMQIMDSVTDGGKGDVVAVPGLTFSWLFRKGRNRGNVSYMPWPAAVGKIDPNEYRWAHLFTWAIAQHKHKNRGARNENRIRVKTILKECPDFPTPESIREQGSRDVKGKVYAVFKNNMDALKEAFSWAYVGKPNGWMPTAYSEFLEANIDISWRNYPVITDQSGTASIAEKVGDKSEGVSDNLEGVGNKGGSDL